MATTQCLSKLDPFGSLCGTNTPLTKSKALYLTLADFEFNTFSDAAGTTKILEGIRDQKVFPILEIDDEEIKDSEDSETETPTGKTIFNYEGIRKRIYKVTQPLDVHQKLRGYSFSKLRVMIGDMNGYLMGTSPDGTKFKGFKIGYFRVKKQNWEGFVTEFQINYADNEEWDSKGVYIKPAWSMSDTDGLTKVELTLSTVNQTTHVFTATVAYVDATQKDSTGTSKSVAISGLVAANFELFKTGGTSPCVVDSVVESSTLGTYTVTAHVGTFTGGTVQIKPSVTALYISDVETSTPAS